MTLLQTWSTFRRKGLNFGHFKFSHEEAHKCFIQFANRTFVFAKNCLTVLLLAVSILCGFVSVAKAVTVSGTKNIVVLRVYFHDYTNTSRYTKTQVEGFFTNINTLWGTHSSYSNISLNTQINDALIQLPDNRSAYIDDFPDGDLSNGGKFQKVIDDAIANSTGFTWTNIDAVMVVMAETDTTQLHRGQGGTCNAHMGPGSSDTPLVGCAIFSENPGNTDAQVWGRWAMSSATPSKPAERVIRAGIRAPLNRWMPTIPVRPEYSKNKPQLTSDGCRTANTKRLPPRLAGQRSHFMPRNTIPQGDLTCKRSRPSWVQVVAFITWLACEGKFWAMSLTHPLRRRHSR